jgi:glycosyltransferase involved in cell wall biosynthesis
MPGTAYSFPVMLVQSGLEVDHYAGVDRALGVLGIANDRLFSGQPPRQLTEHTRAVVICDLASSLAALAAREARRVGARLVLVMDGLVEYRNTFLNPRNGAQFLRPAPADLVVCCGETDERVLTAMGNRAVATGLPRLDRLAAEGPLPPPDRPGLLVATANTPAFNEEERHRLLEALRRLRTVVERMGIAARWRLTGGLASDLGVERDASPVRESLGAVSAVITTSSTLLVESMLAGRPTAILHAHPTPLWQAAAWGWRGGKGRSSAVVVRGAASPAGPGADWSGASTLDDTVLSHLRNAAEAADAMTPWHHDAAAMIESMLSPAPSLLARQAECLARLCHAQRPAAGEVARAIGALITEPHRGATGKVLPSPVRSARALARADRPRVVSCVVCEDSAVGGVLTWSQRLARAFAARRLGYDARTLVIAACPDRWRGEGIDTSPEGLTELCVVDPCADSFRVIEAVRQSLERMHADIVLPNYTDISYVAAMNLRAATGGRVRVVAVAHTDEPYYQGLISAYDRWDAGVGVSAVCAQWLRAIEESTRGGGEARPVEAITYGVPIADDDAVEGRQSRGAASAGEPLRLAYLGRMVEIQKRISDLLTVIDGLESRGVAYEFHMVGDGADLPAWRESLGRRTLRTGRVHFHGARPVEWVESFLPTIDVSVLVSEFEGTSLSMLEAMGAGVVPAVTAVSSGVSEWVEDDVNGVIVPVGQPDLMAARLAALAVDRARLARMGRAAWETVRARASVDAMAFRYAELFDRVLARPADGRRTDLGLRLLCEPWRWSKRWVEDEGAALAWIENGLREAGYRRPVYDRAIQGCDAVIVRAALCAHDPVAVERARRWRERGLGVVFAPHLLEPSYLDEESHHADVAVERIRRIVAAAVAAGCRRIVAYGTGKHTRRVAPVFTLGLPFVGFMDDRPPPWEHMFGLPIVHTDRVMEELRPDAILLSSDAFEEQMWRRCEGFRRRGVRVLPVYKDYDAAKAA